MSEDIKQICFKMISNVGMAKSNFIYAIKMAKEKNYDKARELIKEGQEFYLKGHKVHGELITKMARGEDVEINLLLLHAEDQLMMSETFRILSEEFLDLYTKLNEK